MSTKELRIEDHTELSPTSFSESNSFSFIQETAKPVNKTSVQAWILTFTCVMINCFCAVMWMTASSTPAVMSQWMNISLTKLNWLSNASAICNSIFSLPTAWFYERYGIKTSIILCGTINAIGCWIRCFAIIVADDKKYIVFMSGQVISSIAGPLIYNIAAKFVAVWFVPKDRGLANIILSIQIGMAVGPLILPLITPNIHDIPRMLFIVAGLATVFTIPAFFLPGKPKTPPSVTSTLDRTPFWQGVKIISRNFQFWSVAVVAASTIGMVFSVSVLIIEAITPYGYTDQEAGLCAAIVVISGCIGGGMTGYWLGKSPQHYMLIRTFTPLIIFTYVMFIFNLMPNSFPTVLTVCILNGLFSYALFPVYLELSSEITYPVSESIGSCIIWSMCTTFMFAFSILIDALKASPDATPPNNMNLSMRVVVGIITAGNIPVLWMRGNLKRSQIDNQEKHLC
ncbi:major facilitator superfamily domain-containing protein [Thamnidium elegans]|nr:major facilitator superfamily domain-containing protein [Thamnidium elegans]